MIGSKRKDELDYHEQTYASHHWIVRYPHQARYRAAARAVLAEGAHSLLDYGAGTGYLFEELARSGAPASIELTAYEPVNGFATLIRREVPGIERPVEVVGDLGALDGITFDVITCLGVLEHLPLPERQRFYRLCGERLRPGGVVIVDVPVEQGLSSLIKEAGRVVLKGRKPEMTLRQACRSGLGRLEFDPARFDPDSAESYIHFHTGFDHRLLEAELRHRFRIESSFPTPLGWLPPLLGNQEMFFVLGLGSGRR